ncbi:hypothetical protein VSDG_00623 [Cytospora chrysosperma]|uniref:Sensitive to high expression protein 9, mitochondrial n=1 Tax=Cytospora chrysosperma TaxID=252740 RepID=A0A423WPQ3_CYTCH|nr:hypothetical protein VSDG_00623 [Valsa sordida]
MTGPVAATRPLLRSGSSLFYKQLSGPPIIPRSFRQTSSFSSLSGPVRQLSTCLDYRPQGRSRFYSTQPPPSTSSPSPPESKKETKDPTDNPPSPPSPPPASEESSSPPQYSPELPSQTDSRRSSASQNFAQVMDNLQSRVLVASQALNDLTGYSAIESIKAANARLESDLAAAQANLKRARQHYKAVNAQRAGTQREVTTLLARKDTWSPMDLERFTSLYRQDHELEAAVSEASSALTEAEAEEARLSQSLNSGILKRYHEEQIWSDRIRRQSTWGTWGLMGVNVLLFLVLQFVAEPWKRSRLMKGIAAEEKAALEAVRKELEEVKGVMDFLRDPTLWRPALEDLYSERMIDLRMRDVSLIVLEGAATGAVVAAGIAMVVLRQK